MKRTALDNPAYRSFTRSSQKALEVLHAKMQQEISYQLKIAIIDIGHYIRIKYPRIEKEGFWGIGIRDMDKLKRDIVDRLHACIPAMTQIIQYKRKNVYTLSRVSQSEAIARASTRLVITKPFHQDLLEVINDKMASGGTIHHRLELAMSRLAFKINDAIQLSRALESSLQDCLDRVAKVLPKVLSYKNTPNTLKTPKLKEADGETKTNRFAAGFITDEEWDDVVDDYLNKFIPPYRSPDTVFDVPEFDGDTEDTEYYGWEIEKQLTHDFVSDVRDGANDAAKEAGISDFIFVAVIDDKTDECCLWRHGLTLTEIEAQLDDHDEDECDGLEPPLHFNCRCDLSPMIEDMPEQSPSNAGDFEDWLNG